GDSTSSPLRCVVSHRLQSAESRHLHTREVLLAPIRSTAVEATQETQNRMRTPGGNGLQLGVPGVHRRRNCCPSLPHLASNRPPLGATALRRQPDGTAPRHPSGLVVF